MLFFYGYPKCGTCRKAQKWLSEHGQDVEYIHMIETPPSKEELRTFFEKSEVPLTKFFNTSGQRYRELGMKDKMKEASEEELLEWLASDGMLIKRPIVTDGNKVTVGFSEELYAKTWAG